MESLRPRAARPPNHGMPGEEGEASGETVVQPPPIIVPPSGDSLSIWVAQAEGHTPGSSAPAQPLDDLVRQLIDEMTAAWWRGDSPRAEQFFERYPELRDYPDAAFRLIRAEARLHRQAGRPIPTVELVRRFPEWRDRLGALADPTPLVGPSAPAPQFPDAGERLGEFTLRAVLDRGARGIVYLAEQPELADRPVVLKVTPRDGREHLSLARLQHANIVPLYTVHDIDDRDLRLLCMPYLGGTTLARLLAALSELPVAQRTGRDVLEALDVAQEQSPVAMPSQGPARQLLARVSYLKALCWIGSCLAEALHFAHQRALLHLDVKPSNVLLAADGTPMLLDFHLTQPPIRAGTRASHRLGGTPAYMAPEQWAAMCDARDGRPIASAVDGRADIYALGVLLYEALGGELSGGFCPTLGLRFRRPAGVPWGLADIVAKCLAFDPEGRYPTAALVAEDLRRQFADLPLRGAPNRSLGERWGKWRRRRPQALGRAVALSAALGGLVAGTAVALGDAQQRLRASESLLAESRGLLDGHEYAAAARALERGLGLVSPGQGPSLVTWLPKARRVRRVLSERLEFARDARLSEELHGALDRLRFLHGTDVRPPGDLRAIEHALGSAWGARERLVRWLHAPIEPEQARQVRSDALDLAILWSNLRVSLASGSGVAAARREALATLAEAERLFGPSTVVERERQTYAEALGLTREAEAAAARVRALKPRSAWEHYALGRSLLDAGALDAAAKELEQAAELEPHDVWGHFYRGCCAYRSQRFEDAIHAFDICVALAPKSAECYYNRARAESALHRFDAAERDYGQALRHQPHFAGAALNLGALRYRAGDYARAAGDFAQALAAGADPVAAHYNLALAHLAQGDRDAARHDIEQVLQRDPDHKEARQLARRLADSAAQPD